VCEESRKKQYRHFAPSTSNITGYRLCMSLNCQMMLLTVRIRVKTSSRLLAATLILIPHQFRFSHG
jgi:hypothetical protein